MDPKFLSSQHGFYYSAMLFYYSGSNVITPDPKFLVWIQSYYSRSKVLTLDLKLLLRIQSFYSGSKVVIPDPKLLLCIQSFYSWFRVIISDPKLLLRIQSYYPGSKVISPDPKFFLWIQRYYSGSRVLTLDPRLLLQIQRSNPIWSLNTWHPVHHSTWRLLMVKKFSFLFNLHGPLINLIDILTSYVTYVFGRTCSERAVLIRSFDQFADQFDQNNTFWVFSA